MKGEYEYIQRPNYEMRSLCIWIVAGVAVYCLYKSLDLPPLIFMAMGSLCAAMALGRSFPAISRYLRDRRLKIDEDDKEFIVWKSIKKAATPKAEIVWLWKIIPWIEKRVDQVLLGEGFAWTQKEIQKANEIINEPPKYYQSSAGRWIHGIGAYNESILGVPLKDLEHHTLIIGSTGTGKTRLFDLMISQAIFRNEPVIVIDPKGDHGLRRNMRLACERMGAGNRFMFFHPGMPERSVRLDPLKNFNRHTELASRVAALIPSETRADPWWAYGWQCLEATMHGMLYLGLKPNLMAVRRYIETGVDDIMLPSIQKYFHSNWPGVALKPKFDDVIRQYRQYSAQKPELAVQGLFTMYTHNREHFQKMIASLIPILSMLTAGDLRYLLSPAFGDGDPRPALDLATVIEKKGVLYVGLDSLADATIGSAIGSILVAEATAVAGARCNQGQEADDDLLVKQNQALPDPVNIFVDEAAEVVNEPAVQLLNKSRSAGYRISIATQTLADLMVRTGTEAGAQQVIGNVNNWIVLRVIDPKTQKYISQALPKTVVRTLQKGYRSGSRSDAPTEFHSMYTEAIQEKPTELFPSELLGMLPKFHYFAKFANGTTWKGKLPIIKY